MDGVDGVVCDLIISNTTKAAWYVEGDVVKDDDHGSPTILVGWGLPERD